MKDIIKKILKEETKPNILYQFYDISEYYNIDELELNRRSYFKTFVEFVPKDIENVLTPDETVSYIQWVYYPTIDEMDASFTMKINEQFMPILNYIDFDFDEFLSKKHDDLAGIVLDKIHNNEISK